MDDQVSKRKLYKIPPNNISDNRRKFYDLKADNDEWISRLFDHIYDCDYPKGGEYILTDKYMCELKPEERDTVCEADLNWSTKFLFVSIKKVKTMKHEPFLHITSHFILFFSNSWFRIFFVYLIA